MMIPLGAPAFPTTETIRARAPLFFFHPQEKHGPMAPENFLKEVRFEGGRTAEALSAADFEALPEDSILATATPLLQEVSSRVPALFWQRGASPLPKHLSGTRDLSLVEYWIHLPFNETGLWFGLGTHQGDWEGVALLFDEEHVVALYASQHDGGRWFCPADARWSGANVGEGRPVFFSALGTHATYATPGTHQRNLLGLGDDVTAQGPLYDGAGGLRELSAQPFAGFRGHWGAWSWIPWNRGPRLPNPTTKFLPRDRDPSSLIRMAEELRTRCGIR